MKHRRVTLALVMCLIAGGLAGCVGGGGDRPAPPRPSGSAIVPGRPGQPNQTVPATRGSLQPPGAADVRFVEMMVPHHQQALDMAALVPGRAASGKVKAMADRIDAAQRAEITQMRSWLRGHAQGAHEGHRSAGSMQMPGMATPRQMARLERAAGGDFDRLFLTLMITHHQGALTMAQDELTQGTDVLIQEMAQEVVVTQTAEINRMRALL
jgi:uncharacterized protein (DUF305 family)